MLKTKPGIGFSLMLLGFIGVIGCTFYTLTTNDLDGIRLASILNFLCLLTFMLGSILEIKDVWFSFALLVHGNESVVSNKKESIKESEPEYIPTKKSLVSDIIIIIILIIIILIISFIVTSPGILS